jgi:hypothetical protein
LRDRENQSAPGLRLGVRQPVGGLLGWDEKKAFESLERRFDPDTARFIDETDHAGVRDVAEPPRAGPPNRTTRALFAPSDRRLAADSDEVIVSGNGR